MSLASTSALSDHNPGMTSGTESPSIGGHTDAVPDVLVQTPPNDLLPAFEQLAISNDQTITKDHIADPILRHLADQQTDTRFCAQPAPSSTYEEGLGPRLSKSAALRMGLQWEDPRETRRVSGEEVPVDFDNVPGHKRSNLDLHVAALAEPIVAPRQNRAAMLRAGQVPVEKEVRDRAEIAAANKAREAAERLEKRKSVQLPASLLAPLPENLPRQNRAALLRARQPVEDTARTPQEMAENAIRNKARDAAERAERRRSIQAPASLSAPTIAPRSNRSSVLRANKGDANKGDSSPSSEQSRPASRMVGNMGPPPPRPPRSHARTMSSVSHSTTASTAATGTSRSSSPKRTLNKRGSHAQPKTGLTGAEQAAAMRLAAQKALEERATAARAEKMARRQTMQPLKSLREPTLAPRANRSSVLRGGTPLNPLPRSDTITSVGSDRTDMAIKETSPARDQVKPMPTPTRYIQPRPAPAPPGRPISTISFSLPEKGATDKAGKRTSMFSKLLKPQRENLSPAAKSTASPKTARRTSILQSVKL